ncbi:MAG: 4'-phosphopantetheinyl transferase superfamily protein [Clostridiales bacterium]|nr:4'-phosphopantetheinyl transferase superfamily protein [Clostridiales bacterium]
MIELFSIRDISQTEYDYYFSLMTDEKKKKTLSFRFEDDKKRTVCADMLARKMLGKVYGIPEESISVFHDSDGKPTSSIEGVFLSLSHSGDYALCALSDCPVGADIEEIHEIPETTVRRVCNEDELAYLSEAESEDERTKRFFEIWTGKEAVFKSGCGKGDNITEISVMEEAVREKLKCMYRDGYCISIYEDKE